ncbi:hypothetical protein EVAR_101120_1 [Eumeta japonica]|uniref:Uncharacterized protein n=1 Tax=Eumeta variegata TaxID=151549 RepID=A0A4C1T9G2_EUMVA|nr:hypothetical protein EVAR_101120_1 [Eumeta japonica]
MQVTHSIELVTSPTPVNTVSSGGYNARGVAARALVGRLIKGAWRGAGRVFELTLDARCNIRDCLRINLKIVDEVGGSEPSQSDISNNFNVCTPIFLDPTKGNQGKPIRLEGPKNVCAGCRSELSYFPILDTSHSGKSKGWNREELTLLCDVVFSLGDHRSLIMTARLCWFYTEHVE